MVQRPKHAPLEPHEFDNILGEVQSPHDRTVAITASALVEDRLGAAIKKLFVSLPESSKVDVTIKDIFDNYGPLSSFKGKIDIGRAMGLYGEITWRDLNSIRKIRNEFAHGMKKIDFDDETVRKYCEKLEIPSIQPRQSGLSFNRQTNNVNKDKYIYSCVSLCNYFHYISDGKFTLPNDAMP